MYEQAKDKVVVITGGSSGIGFATAKLFLQYGAKVAICGRNEARLIDAQQELQQRYPKGQIVAHRCDVLSIEQVLDFAHHVEKNFKGVDMIINNAGQGRVSDYFDTSDEAWLDEVKLKLHGVLNPTKAFLSLLEKSDIASITCVNSLLALQPEEHMIATSAARAALLNLTLTLSKTFIKKNIRVNSILLGIVESAQWRKRYLNRSDQSLTWEQWSREIAQQRSIPMQRFGRPEEAAQALFFLATPLSSFTTGATLDVSGGFNRHI